jgi:hypothetical protein
MGPAHQAAHTFPDLLVCTHPELYGEFALSARPYICVKSMHAEAGLLPAAFHSTASSKLRNEHVASILRPVVVQVWFGAVLKLRYRRCYVAKQRQGVREA